MTILDKAKTTAEHGVELGRARIEEMRVRRQRNKLMQQLGEARYAEHSGSGTREAVDQALAAVDAHTRAQARASAERQAFGRLEAARRARDIMHPGAECIGENDSVATAAQR